MPLQQCFKRVAAVPGDEAVQQLTVGEVGGSCPDGEVTEEFARALPRRGRHD
jgi:hypothetical protein